MTDKSQNQIIWQGDLEEKALVEVVGKIYAQKLSGVLKVNVRKAEYKIYFLDGIPAFAQSSLKSDNLFELMVKLGELERDDVPRLEKMVEEGKEPEQALLEMGVVHHSRIYYLKQILAREIIIRACSHRQGQFQFFETQDFLDRVPLYDINPLEVIYEVINHFHLQQLPETIQKFGKAQIQLNPEISKLERLPDVFYQRIYLLDCFQRPLSVEEAVSVFINEFRDLNQALGMFYFAYASGILEIKRPSREISKHLSDKEAEPSRQEPPSPDSRIASDYIYVRRAKKAQEKKPLSQEEKPKEKAQQEPQKEVKKPSLDRLRKLELMEAKINSSMDYYQLLGIKPDSSIAELEQAYSKILRRLELDELIREAEPKVAERAQRIKEVVKNAVSTLSNPYERDQYEKKLFKEELKRAWNLELKKELAKKQFERGKWFLEHNHPQLALERFEQAIELDPEASEYFAHTGWAMYRASKGSIAEAEGYIKQALRLNPAYDKAYYFLGLIRKKEGDEERAEEYFKKALSLNPRNQSVGLELSALEKRKKSKGAWTRLFSKK